MRAYRDAPSEVVGVVNSAKALFDNAPVPVWCKYEDGTLVYASPHYRETIVDYEGGKDLDAWDEKTSAKFAEGDAHAAAEGSVIVHEHGYNPTTGRPEHWLIAKWSQQVVTPQGPRRLVWGILLTTVAGREKLDR